MAMILRAVAAFAILQAVLLAAPNILSAPTNAPTAEICLACAGECDLESCHRVAMELAMLRDYDRAIAIERKVFELDPSNPQVAAALAKMYETGRRDVVHVLKYYHEALAASPGYPPALLGLGMAMQDRGEMAIAERYFERGARENPDLPLFKVRLAEVMIETGRADRAQPLLEAIVEGWPGTGEADSARRLMGRTALAKP